MAKRSKRHHEVPRWLLREFCRARAEWLWVGFKATSEVRQLHVSAVFVRSDGNTRTDYVPDGTGGFSRVRSDPDEQALATFDAETSAFARQLLGEARHHRSTGQPLRLSWETVEGCKTLIVGQARRTIESQQRIGLMPGDEDLQLDLLYQRADGEGRSLPGREELASLEETQVVLSDLSQNKSANFSSGSHPILSAKESDFLNRCGLQVAVTDRSGDEFVIGSHGVTICDGGAGGSWLPLAPDVAIGLSSEPDSYAVGTCPGSFVNVHNRSALDLSQRLAGSSKQVIEDLLNASNGS